MLHPKGHRGIAAERGVRDLSAVNLSTHRVCVGHQKLRFGYYWSPQNISNSFLIWEKMLLNTGEDLRGLLDETSQSACLGSYTALLQPPLSPGTVLKPCSWHSSTGLIQPRSQQFGGTGTPMQARVWGCSQGCPATDTVFIYYYNFCEQ